MLASFLSITTLCKSESTYVHVGTVTAAVLAEGSVSYEGITQVQFIWGALTSHC